MSLRRAPSLALALATFALAAEAGAQATVAVDPTQGVHGISPLIYGVNFPSNEQIDQGGLTVGRWGGNSTTRYNYAIDTTNTAADYFYENVPGCWNAGANWCANPPADPMAASGANAFLTQLAAKGTVTLFTIPTIGWVAKAPPKYGHPFDCGCPKSVNPAQDAFDQYDGNCGNGKSGNAPTTCGGPSATSVAVDPAWAKAWVTYIVGKFGPANGKRIYALDNEPALWSSTHHDLRDQRLTYDELWQRMRDYAVAILDADPTAEISGPAEWGWPNYFCSDADLVQNGCFATSPDRAKHGGTELVAWLLDQAHQYETANGRRILHYLDLHYYPQGGDLPATTRSLWDPSYKDPSWINDTIRLLPRMRDWVSQHYAGTRLAVSEYDFGHHGDAMGAVGYAEVLGLFGREGLDLGTAWSPPAPTDAAFAAYRLYRNFDGKGGTFEQTSVQATVTGQGVQAYAAVGPMRMTVAVVNESGAAVSTDVTVGNFKPGAMAQVYGNGGGAMITKLADVPVQGGKVTFQLPGTSIALVVIDGSNPNTSSSTAATTSAATTGSGAGGHGGAASGGGQGPAGPSATGATATAGAGGGSGGAGSAPGSKSGCGCRVGESPSGSALASLGALVAAGALASRRRHRR